MLEHNVIGITGRFGSGKTLHAMELAIEFANRTRKPIITNFSVDASALRAYAKVMGFYWVANCSRILRVELFEDINEIWRYRHSVFVFDEAGIFVNSRSWKTLSKEFLRNLFQIRHLNIHLICVFQNPMQVDKQLRENIQHWVVCKSTSFYSNELKAPRIVSRFCYHYDEAKFNRLLEDTRARGNIILPWFWAEFVHFRFLIFFKILCFLRNSFSEFLDVFVFVLSSGKRRFLFVRHQPREYWLFSIFSSTAIVGSPEKKRSHSDLAPFLGRYDFPYSE